MLRKSSETLLQPPLFRRVKSLRTLKQLHSHLLTAGLLPSLLPDLIFLSSISLPSALPYALLLFRQTPHKPSLFIFNTLIRASSHSPTPLLSLRLLSLMPSLSLLPDPHSFPFLFRASSKLDYPLLIGSQLHALAFKLLYFGSHPYVRNSLINLYATCGQVSAAENLFNSSARRDPAAWSAVISGYARRGDLINARRMFDESGEARDLVSWNVMISRYVRVGDMGSAWELFELAPERDVVSWNAMIAGYVRCGGFKRAMEVFERMCWAGMRPDDVTMLSLVSACADKGDLEVGRRVHELVLGMCNGRELRTVLGNAIIDMYGKCGRMDFAMEVFRGMRERDLSSWNSVVCGLACNGQCEGSVRLFEEMLRLKVRPDEITFVSVLVACNHGGMVEQGRWYYDMMQSEYGIEPNLKHYGCVVDMLGRAGHLEDAFEFVDRMGIKPNPVIWRALLGSCKTHGNVRLAERANEELLKMRDNSSGDYVLLSNLYASTGEWIGAEKVRKLMDDRGVHKAAGGALIGTDAK